MPPAARVTDTTTHGSPLAPGPGSVNVLIGNLPAWRAMIDQHACPMVSISGADGVGSVMMGSPTVLINNQMACRLGDIVMEKPGLVMGPVNPIIMGEMTVMIGEVGMGSPVIVTPMAPMVALANAMNSAPAQALGTENAAPMPPMVALANAMNSAPANALAQAAQSGAPFIEPCPG